MRAHGFNLGSPGHLHRADPVRNILSVNPFRACMWSLHDRCDRHVNEETCRAEIESFATHGQLVPAPGRLLRDDPDHEVELIYGARRLFVARHLNRPLKRGVSTSWMLWMIRSGGSARFKGRVQSAP